MKVEIGQIISQIFSFLIMFWILKKYAWRPILKFLEERQQKISSQFEEIVDQKDKVSHLVEEYKKKLKEIDNHAETRMNEIIKVGEEKVREIQQRAEDRAKAIIRKAEQDAQHEIQRAKLQLKKEIVDLVFIITEKFFQTDQNQEKQKKIVLNFVEQMEQE